MPHRDKDTLFQPNPNIVNQTETVKESLEYSKDKATETVKDITNNAGVNVVFPQSDVVIAPDAGVVSPVIKWKCMECGYPDNTGNICAYCGRSAQKK